MGISFVVGLLQEGKDIIIKMLMKLVCSQLQINYWVVFIRVKNLFYFFKIFTLQINLDKNLNFYIAVYLDVLKKSWLYF